jgi:hypothetical protein
MGTLTLPAAGLVRHLDDLAAGAGGQGRQQRVGVVAQEAHGAVGEQEVRPAGVQAPEVEDVARVVQRARPKRVRPARRAGRRSVAGRVTRLCYSQQHVRRAVEVLSHPGVPPAEPQVRSRWPLARQQRVACPVRDVAEPDPGVKIEDTVAMARVRTGHS